MHPLRNINTLPENQNKTSFAKRIKLILAVFWAKYFSLDSYFRKTKAVAEICFVGEDKLGGSIKLRMGGTTYYFENKQPLESWKDFIGEEVVCKRMGYGGWEMDMTHPDHV